MVSLLIILHSNEVTAKGPASPNLFVVAGESLAIAVCQNTAIKGVTIERDETN